PERFRSSFNHETGEPNDPVIMTPRVTGDLAVSPDGKTIAVPVLYVDHFTSVDNDDGEIGETGGYSSGPGVGRTNPVVLMVESDGGGDPSLERQRTFFMQGMRSVVRSGAIDQQNVRSYLSSLTFSPDGLMVLASMEGSEAVLGLPLNVPEDRNSNIGRGGVGIDFGEGFEQDPGFEFRAAFSVVTDAGPRGLVFTGRQEAMVDSWLDRSVAHVPFGDLHDGIRQRVLQNNLFQGDDIGLSIERAVESSPLTVDASVDEGRKLFYSATNGSMAAHSGGISCATCHTDGRNDGLSWAFAEGDRQTPSLAGNVTATEPVTWTKNFEGEPISVDLEVRLTSGTRMGGSGAGIQQSFSVQDYIDFTPYPQTAVDLDADAVARGREIFNGSAECSSCHNGAQFTDSQPYAMVGLEAVRTPTLRGIAATAPYLHDGRAADLAELVAIAERVGMGKTVHLSAEEKADLVTYLESL
ncbi:MAG: cytochrome-c peroxidase, partial [Myxococcota bacterium]